jgi:tRNA A-37 threonylcarbamoyl transferase component Bud32/ligand-binding sensor domain-containing protein
VIVRYLLALIILMMGSVAWCQQLSFVHIAGSAADSDALFQDRQGRMWVSANGDVACFDGTRFYWLREFGLPPVQVTQFAEDSAGGLWIGADAGLFRFYGGHVERIMASKVISLVATASGVVLASTGTDAGRTTNASLMRIRYDGFHWRTEKALQMESEGRMSLDHNGAVLFPCAGVWCEVAADELIRWRPPAALSVSRHERPTNTAVWILRDRFGCLWWRTQIETSYQCSGDLTSTALDLGGTPISEAEDGTLLLPQFESLKLGRPGAFKTASPVNGLPLVNRALMARDGTIWITAAQGLYCLVSPFRLEYWTERDGLVLPMSIAQIGRKTFTTSPDLGGILILSADRRHWVHQERSSAIGEAWDLMATPEGNLLAALPHLGVAEVAQDGTILASTRPDDKEQGAKLARTPDGRVWVSGKGIGRVTRKGDRMVITREQLPDSGQNGLDIEYEPVTRKLWGCYDGGLLRKDTGGWRRIGLKEGLLEETCRSIAVHPDGDVWFLYNTTNGFARIQATDAGVAVRQYRSGSEVGTAANGVFFGVDSRGWLWRSASDGIWVASALEAEAGTWLQLTETDGLPNHDSNQQSFHNDPDGSVWWSAGNAIIHFNPGADFVTPQAVPQIFVSGLSSNEGPPKLAETAQELPYGSKLTAHLGSLQFDRRNALRVRYRTLPEQPGWRETRNLDLVLGSPSWGSHTIEVQARLFTGPWSAVTRQQFTILRPFWFSWPIVSLFALGGSAATLGAYSRRKRRREVAGKLLPDMIPWRDAAFAGTDHPLSGSVLDSRYEVGTIIARGGFAIVLAGKDRSQNNRPCAIKIFRPGILDEEWITKRFRQEVTALEQIEHPNVVRVLSDGISPDGEPYLAMEYIEGQTLRGALQAGALPPRQVASLLRQAASALDAIHARGIFHRDLKPENMMLRSETEPGAELVIIDFSIALVKDRDRTIHELSRAGGTLDYMPPEQPQGYAEPASDIYSLAKVLVEMLTGLPIRKLLPSAALDLPQQVRRVLVERSFGLSPVSLDLMSAAREFHPASRPKSAGNFAGPIVHDLECLSPDSVS